MHRVIVVGLTERQTRILSAGPAEDLQIRTLPSSRAERMSRTDAELVIVSRWNGHRTSLHLQTVFPSKTVIYVKGGLSAIRRAIEQWRKART